MTEPHPNLEKAWRWIWRVKGSVGYDHTNGEWRCDATSQDGLPFVRTGADQNEAVLAAWEVRNAEH